MEQNQNQGPQNNNDNNNNQGPKNKQPLLILLICVMVVMFVVNLLTMTMQGGSGKIKYSEFVDLLEQGKVQEVQIKGETLRVTLKEQQRMGAKKEVYTVLSEDKTNLVKRLERAGVDNYYTEQPNVVTEILFSLISLILPIVLMFFLLNMLFRRMNKNGGMMGGVGKSKAKAYVQKETGITFKDVAGQDEAKESLQEVVDFLHNPGKYTAIVGKSKAKAYVQKETGITFKDVAGQDEAKESLQEVVDFLHNPGKYTAIGAKLPKGALLVGPPGTGKTLLAKAVAGEAHVPFFSLSGSDFVEMFVGVGASRVRDLFEEAKKNAPCIIFIDEVDAIGKSRDSRYGGNDEREQTLNQLLAEMDGFDTSKGLLILAATNRPEVLDPALLRPGRFDRRVIVDRPDLKGRISILKVHAKNVSLDETLDLEGIALATSGAVGSDLANMVNEAAILAVKNGRQAVSQKDLLEAVEVVLVGKEKKDRILSKEERKIVSYHEVGHALVSALQKDSEPVQKLSRSRTCTGKCITEGL